MTRSTFLLLALLLGTACKDAPADAYGRFEATEVTLSAEAAGPVLAFAPQEGSQVAAGDSLGAIDIVLLDDQRAELDARRRVLGAKADELRANQRVIDANLSVAQSELARTERLVAAKAATVQQLERATRESNALREQRSASDAGVRALSGELAALDAQLAQLAERRRRTVIRSPIRGTVLTRFAEVGEMVGVGSPLATIAALDTIILRAYVAEAQLSAIKVGQAVQVQVDDGAGGLRAQPGTVRWISSSAEFTPTPIQTRDERVSQVYAVKIAVPNTDGRLRIGMPGELLISAEKP